MHTSRTAFVGPSSYLKSARLHMSISSTLPPSSNPISAYKFQRYTRMAKHGTLVQSAIYILQPIHPYALIYCPIMFGYSCGMTSPTERPIDGSPLQPLVREEDSVNGKNRIPHDTMAACLFPA